MHAMPCIDQCTLVQLCTQSECLLLICSTGCLLALQTRHPSISVAWCSSPLTERWTRSLLWTRARRSACMLGTASYAGTCCMPLHAPPCMPALVPISVSCPPLPASAQWQALPAVLPCASLFACPVHDSVSQLPTRGSRPALDTLNPTCRHQQPDAKPGMLDSFCSC